MSGRHLFWRGECEIHDYFGIFKYMIILVKQEYPHHIIYLIYLIIPIHDCVSFHVIS